MRASVQGICSILSHEAIILSTYDDGTGVLTIGAGHTSMAGPPTPTAGMTISLTEAFNIFRRDLYKYEKEVLQAIDVPLTQNQFDALVSWHFNTGRINNSTLTNKLNDGDYEGAATEFARWNKAGGKVLQGLVKRRKSETAIFRQADYGNDRIIVRASKGAAAQDVSPAEIASMVTGAPQSEADQTTSQLLANPKSRLLPKFRPRQSEQTSRAALKKFQDLIPQGRQQDRVFVLAVRGYYTNSLGEKGKNDRGLYDDAIFVIEPNGVHNFNGNTDPSVFRKGIAKLKAPQAVRYIPGPHGFKRKNGPYPAFRQDSACTVVRDQKGDDTGIFWINLHRGGVSETSSAGCQTVPPHQWDEFRSLVNNLLEEHNQSSFYYVLLDVDDVPKVAASDQQTEKLKPVQSGGSEVMANNKQAELLEIVSTLLQLSERVQHLRGNNGKGETPSADNQGTDSITSVLRTLLATLGDEQNNLLSPPHLVKKPKELTPINSALGETVGRALDGRKTGLGIIGLLGTTLLPIFFPQLAPIAAVAKTVTSSVVEGAAATKDLTTGQSILAAAQPIFMSLAAWGGLGKVDKWINKLKT